MKTLGELILTDYAAARQILEAWARGETLEWLHSVTGNWHNATRPIELEAVYRIPPRPHTVDWSQVGEWCQSFYTDRTGCHWAHGKQACNLSTSHNTYSLPADLWPSFRPGTMPWKDSRIERPKEVK